MVYLTNGEGEKPYFWFFKDPFKEMVRFIARRTRNEVVEPGTAD